MKYYAKVRYVDFQNRNHFVTVESDFHDSRHIEQIVKAQYPAKKVYLQTISTRR